MQNKEILMSVDEQEKRVAVLENGKIEEFFLERNSVAHLAGNIYKGKVAQVVKGMEAAFVNIGLEKNGFLYVQELLPESLRSDEYAIENADEVEKENSSKKSIRQTKTIDKLLTKGQDVLVQVVKEPFGTKGCRLTSQISLPGRFLVLMPYSKNIGISKKITNEKERQRLKALLKEIGLPKDMGCIMRTQAQRMGKREFARELKYLLRLWRIIKIKSSRRNAPCLIHEEYDLTLRVARDFFNDDIKEVLIDNKEDYKKVMGFIKTLAPHLRRYIHFFKEKMPLFEKHDTQMQIEKIFAQKVSLKKGGYIVIERTEALVSIDVNSGSFVNRGRLEETAFLTNLEAAKEIARQAALKDLAGIIVIDFIDMQKSSHQKKVLSVLMKAMENDKARFTIYPFSPLGIVQIARQRIRKNLDSVIFDKCVHCSGIGRVKSVQTIAIAALRQIRYFLQTNKRRHLKVKVHPKIAMRLLNEDRMIITNMEKKMWVKIAIITDEQLGIEEVVFL
ncbi:MAG: Rne/Rng family ribonuclease [Candidatus Omnitrophica bacterium]|nr:Rne/Rng family ribonuclease [Candidatus Omnitrophota bacterium]